MKKTKIIALILGVIVMSFGLGYLAIAWTDPAEEPPSGNVASPLKVGDAVATVDGTATAPSFRFTNDPNTGVYSGGADILAFSTAGSQRVVITAAGDISESANVHGTCAWAAFTCNDALSCSTGYFIAGVERNAAAGGTLCGTTGRQWYQMRVYCCRI
jgi:hypothetical protein